MNGYNHVLFRVFYFFTDKVHFGTNISCLTFSGFQRLSGKQSNVQ